MQVLALLRCPLVGTFKDSFLKQLLILLVTLHATEQRESAGRTAQETLISELVAKLGLPGKQAGSSEVDVTHASRRGSKRKRDAA